MIRLGLCCIFAHQPIRFRTSTATTLKKFARAEQLRLLSTICRDNCDNLLAALSYLHAHGIGAFRINSPFFPRYTHPEVGYQLDDLPEAEIIRTRLADAASFRRDNTLRLSFHPDQFVLLSSPHPKVTEKSILELEYQGMLAELVGAEVITLHGGGGYGNKPEALGRLRKNFPRLSQRVQRRLALENDDRVYTIADLAPVAKDLGIPLVYDVHHHRLNPDGLSVEKATDITLESWATSGREPWLHLSSPKDRSHPACRSHADYIDLRDFPPYWRNLDATIDVEAKAKELAVLQLRRDLNR